VLKDGIWTEMEQPPALPPTTKELTIKDRARNVLAGLESGARNLAENLTLGKWDVYRPEQRPGYPAGGDFPDVWGNTIPRPDVENAQGAQPPSKSDILGFVEQANREAGLEEGLLTQMLFIENGQLDPMAVNASGAAGLFQFVPSSWEAYAQPGEDPTDFKANTRATVALLQENKQLLKRQKIEPTGFNLYLAHQQGHAGTANILSAARGDSVLARRDYILKNLPEDKQKAWQDLDDKSLAQSYLEYYRKTWQKAGETRTKMIKQIFGGS